MRTIKLLVVALFVGLAGTTYALGGAQDAAHKEHAAKATCCKAHTQDTKQDTHSCDMKDGKGCCTGTGGCCPAHKSDRAKVTVAAAQDAKKTRATCGCCEGHKASYSQLSSSTAKGAPAAKTGCCGNDCCKDCGKAHEGNSDKKSAAAPQSGEGHSCCASCGSCKAQVARR